jgi:hypothetical protein
VAKRGGFRSDKRRKELLRLQKQEEKRQRRFSGKPEERDPGDPEAIESEASESEVSESEAIESEVSESEAIESEVSESEAHNEKTGEDAN